MENLWKDIRFGWRMLIRRPAFTAVAVLTLALGIGANTAIFTLFDAVLLQSLPVRQPQRLVLFSDQIGEGTSNGTWPDGEWDRYTNESYEFLKKQQLPFESLTAFRSGEDPVTVHFAGQSDSGPAQRANTHLVAGNYFQTLGVDAALGRVLRPEDDQPGANPAAVISNGYWKETLDSDPNVIGKVAILNGTAFTIVGVAPPEFFGERVRHPVDYWLPLVFQPQIMQREAFAPATDVYWLMLMGRLAPGATREQASAAATLALQSYLKNQKGSDLSADTKAEIAKNKVRVVDGSGGISVVRSYYSQPLHVLLVVVALVLLIACANVGNLLLSRAVARKTEVTVRLALGAGRGRLIRQLLTESVLLAGIGMAFGVLLASWASEALLRYVMKTSPVNAQLNTTVLIFTAAITLAAGIIFGLAPALQAGRTDLATSLKLGGRSVAGDRRKFGLTQGLVVAQIAVSLVLLVGSTMFARSLLKLEGVPLGFDQSNVLLARISPRLAGYKPAEVGALYRKLYERLKTMPGVEYVTLASYSPLGGSNSTSTISIEGYVPKPNQNPSTQTIFVGPDYPQALGMKLLAGRAINLQDTPGGQKVAMVNEAFARRYFGNQNPVGHRFDFGDDKGPFDIEIVGLLKDAQFDSADDKEVQETALLSILQNQTQAALEAELELRTMQDPGALSSELRTVVGQEDPRLPVSGVKTLHAQVEDSFKQPRLAARLVSFFGLLALLLACVGLYGVVAQGVARRTNEIGVRMALGAQRGDVLWMVLRDTFVLLVIGLLIGVPAAIGAARYISSQLFNVGPMDIASFCLGIVTLGVVMLFAGFLQAQRASKVDPIVALHYE